MEAPKTTVMTETLTTAVRRAEALATDLQALHRQACDENPVLALLIRDLIGEARAIGMRLEEIASVSRPGD